MTQRVQVTPVSVHVNKCEEQIIRSPEDISCAPIAILVNRVYWPVLTIDSV